MFNLNRLKLAKTISSSPKEENLLFQDNLVRIEREAFRRRISLSVALNDEIRLSVAKSTSQGEILQFLKLQEDWIESRLEKNSRLRLKYPQKTYSEGEYFLFFGQTYRLTYREVSASMGAISIGEEHLIVCVPSQRKFSKTLAHPEMAKPIRDFYRHQGKNYIEARSSEIAREMKLFPKELSFRSQKTRWGSCSTSGHVSFNWRLIIAPQEVIDYVIVHELAHLKHHNHSKNFWSLVEIHVPSYKVLKKWLRDNQFEADFLAKKSELWNLYPAVNK